MRKQFLTALAAIAISAAGYTAVMAAETKPQVACEPAPATQSVMLMMAVAASEPATAPAVDANNTKCLVMPTDDVTPGKTVTYNGKIYHFCCVKCVKAFNKDPETYIKKFEADPAAYGAK